MSNTVKASKKPSYLFVFSDERQSEMFYAFAYSQASATCVQHPLTADCRVVRDHKQVLVTGIGSLLFDITLKDVLIKKAEELGGYYLPKV